PHSAPPHSLVLALVFSWSLPDRALPSFPTRRSSDLVAPSASRTACSGTATVHPVFPFPCISPTARGNANRRVHARAFLSWTLRLDRKSTRLNSSHGSISYAVFCLKKKKTNNNLLLRT